MSSPTASLFLCPLPLERMSAWAGSSSPFHHFLPATAWPTSVRAINKLHIPTSRGHCSLVAFGLSVTLTQEITLSLGKAMSPGLP